MGIFSSEWQKDYAIYTMADTVLSVTDQCFLFFLFFCFFQFLHDSIHVIIPILPNHPTLSLSLWVQKSGIHICVFSSLHLLKVTFHLGVGKVESKGNREVKFHLSYPVSLCLEFTCWIDFAHKNMSISFWSSTDCSLILQVHFFQKIYCCILAAQMPKVHKVP